MFLIVLFASCPWLRDCSVFFCSTCSPRPSLCFPPEALKILSTGSNQCCEDNLNSWMQMMERNEPQTSNYFKTASCCKLWASTWNKETEDVGTAWKNKLDRHNFGRILSDLDLNMTQHIQQTACVYICIITQQILDPQLPTLDSQLTSGHFSRVQTLRKEKKRWSQQCH